MAQNSDALQEPSMDELLASIREIIEENTGIPPQEASQARNANAAHQSRPPQMEGGGRYEAAMPNLKQDIFVRNDSKPAAGPNGRPVYGSPHPNNGGAGPNDGVYQNGRDNAAGAMPAGQAGEPVMSGRAPNGAYPGGGFGQSPNARPMREAPQGQPRALRPEPAQDMRRPDARAAQDVRPVQDSMNALAERIGLRRSPAPVAAYAPPANAGAPQARPLKAERQAAAQPGAYNNAALPQGGSFPPGGGAAAGGRGGAPYPQPQNGNYAYNEGGRPQRAEENEEAALPRFNPAAMAGYRREREAAERERQQLPYEAESRNSRAGFPGADMAAAGQPQNAERAGAADRPEPAESSGHERREMSAAAAYAANELKKAFPADVEHSTEKLLRPFITQWLDEHFRELFEKVLREEVQRFIQSMHRDA